MNPATEPRSSHANGRLWGAQARTWADVQDGQCSVAFEAVFDSLAIRPGTRYCDAGGGAGLAALPASHRGAEVSGIDASESLLGIARERVAAGDFHLGDLEDLPSPDSTFDLVTGFNSFQFAANPVAALIQAKRISKPDGRIAVLTWENPHRMEAAAIVVALKPLLPPPPPGSPGPFALSEEGALKTFAEGAGLTALKVSEVACEWDYENLHTALRGLGSSGVAAKAAQHTGVEAVNKAHEAALAPLPEVMTAAIASGPGSVGSWLRPDWDSHFRVGPDTRAPSPRWAPRSSGPPRAGHLDGGAAGVIILSAAQAPAVGHLEG